ncbi:MAG: hypothetical protein RL088_2574 [Verrucomicrobiota bacterium]|jgi:hypothetical protein
MNTPQRFKIIDGTFSAADATNALLAVVQSKIDFHNVEQLSNEMRFGRDVAHSERRLVELREMRETLRALCKSAAESGMRVEANGWLEVRLVPATGE